MSDCYQVCANCGYANPIRDRAVATCDQCGAGLGKQLMSVTFKCSVCGVKRDAPVKGIGINGAMWQAEAEGWLFKPARYLEFIAVDPKTYCPGCRARKAESDEQ